MNRAPWNLLICLLFAAVGPILVATSCLGAEPGGLVKDEKGGETRIGKRVDNFTLEDQWGKTHSLADLKDKKLVVIAFLGAECPLARLYGPKLDELAQRFADDGVAVLGVNSNSQDSITEIAAYSRRYKISFPILKDVANRVADQVVAKRTPEVFLLDANRVVRYHGRVDDQFGVGVWREQAQRHDLRRAIEQLLEGKAVSLAETPSEGCLIGRIRKPRADSQVTYHHQIVRILQRRCVQCHREGEIGPFALTEYDEVAGWSEMIAEVVKEKRMPPWHASPEHGKFRNDRRLTDEEKSLIFRWARAGAPEGDPKQSPKPRQFVSGWQLPREPDLILDGKEIRIPATGVVPYQWYSVDPKFTEDKWIQAAQLLPGNRAVVHHILVFAKPPKARPRGGARGFLVGYVPGLLAEPYPAGMAKRIPAGSQLVFQVHYTPVGSEQVDLSQLGLVFIDPDKVTHEVKTTSAVKRKLDIPPNDPDYRVSATTSVASDKTLLLSLMPHMHLRGKSFRYEALLPDGRTEVLLDVPEYDFNWQTAYRLAEPRKFPPGTRMHCVASYDNSEDNLNNPDPSKLVHWGDQTWDEMMIGYFDVAAPRRAEPDTKGLLPSNVSAAGRAAQLIQRFDSDGDGIVKRDDLSTTGQRLLFRRLDRNNDGKLDKRELTESLKRIRRER